MKRLSQRSIWFAGALAAALLATAACAGAAQSGSSTRPANQPAAVTGSPSESARDSAAPSPAGEAGGSSAASAAKSAGAAAPAAPDTPDAQTTSNFDQRLIIYNAQVRLAVEDVGQAVQSLTQIATAACTDTATCGFVSESNLRYENDQQVGSVTIQVPSEKYGEALAQVRALGTRVLSETSRSQDVSEEFTDRQSELRALRATEERYYELLRQATSVQDILALEDRLRNIRVDIERIQGRINYLENRAALATISVNLVPPSLAPNTAAPLPQPVMAAQRAWDASLEFLSNVATIIITIVVFFWWMVPFALVALVVARILWTRRRAGTRPPASAPSASASV